MASELPPHLSFRSFVAALREDGDLVEITDEIDPHLEAGAIIKRASETDAEAVLFHNLKGNQNGFWKMLGAPMSLRQQESTRYARLALHLGLPRTASLKDCTDKLQAAKNVPGIPPKIVETGPCKEHILDDFDLDSLPSPWLHRADGGKYLQTYGMQIMQAPDGTWTNWSINRAMVRDKNHLLTTAFPPQHNWQLLQLWKAKGKDMPWALALGVPPAAIFAAGMPLPDWLTEAEYIGALAGSAVEVVKCETNDLYVPANSEIVLEGTISTTEMEPEGPFGELHGYVFPGETHPGPVITVTKITHRSDAILPVCNPGRANDESVRLYTSMYSEHHVLNNSAGAFLYGPFGGGPAIMPRPWLAYSGCRLSI